MVKALFHKVAENPRVYDLIQTIAGRNRVNRFLQPFFQTIRDQIVLDVGAGTGNIAGLLHPSNTYLWFDYDWHKLQGFKRGHPKSDAIIGDASWLTFANKSIDTSVSLALGHHLTDISFRSFLKEMNRITRSTMIFIDAVANNRFSSKFMWSYDRGSFPRSKEQITFELESFFSIIRCETRVGLHEILVCIASPKPSERN